MILNRKELLGVMESSGIKEYGVDKQAIYGKWKNRKVSRVIAGLDNSDGDGVLLRLLETEENLERFICGMEAAVSVLGAKEKVLYIPDYACGLAEPLHEALTGKGIEIKVGLIDVRSTEHDMVCHFITLLELADCISGNYQEGIYISVNGGALSKVLPNRKVSELISDEHVKGLELGYGIYGPEALSMDIGAAKIDNGVIHVFTEQACMVSEVEKRISRSRERSCGTCVFCREGLLQLQEMHKDIREGKGKAEYPELISEIGSSMAYSCMCSLGQEGARAAMGALAGFDTEYMTHIKRKKCAAGVCFSKAIYYIDPATCEGCGECMDVCPADCIEGKNGYIHMIDTIDCTGCGACVPACEAQAIVRSDGKLPKLPNRLMKCGRFKSKRI